MMRLRLPSTLLAALLALVLPLALLGCSGDDSDATVAGDDGTTDDSSASSGDGDGDGGADEHEDDDTNLDEPVDSGDGTDQIIVDPGTEPGFEEALPKEVDALAADPHPVTLNSLAIAADDTTIQMTLWGGPCDGIAAIDVTETDAEVRVAVSVGRIVPADTACIELAELWSATVPLATPLGGRALVDANA